MMEFLPLTFSKVPCGSVYEKESKKRLVRVATKVNEKKIIDASLEKDFRLEDGDPAEFLKCKDTRNPLQSRESHSRNSVGSFKLLDRHKDRTDSVSRVGSRRELRNHRFTMKSLFRPVVENEIPVFAKINLITQRIEENKKNLQLKLKNMTNVDRILYLQQSTCLNKFEKTQSQWKKIENGLTKKSKKLTQQLLSKKSTKLSMKELSFKETEQSAPWCTTLRSGKCSKFEQLIPVGHKLSGLFIKEIINLAPSHKKSSSCPDLTIRGSSKLPLEIQALKNPGIRLFNKKEPEDRYQEETFAENYSSRVNKLWAN